MVYIGWGQANPQDRFLGADMQEACPISHNKVLPDSLESILPEVS